MSTNKVDQEGHGDSVLERLTENEMKQMTVGPSISTITFLRFSENPTENIRDRLGAIVQANPWLLGKLVKREGKLYLKYCKKVDQFDLSNVFNPTNQKRKAAVIHSEMEYKELCGKLGGSYAEIPRGAACINKNEYLFAVSLLQDSKRPQDTVAMVFSLSHVISDGFTYYKLLAMMSSDAVIESLNPTRKHDIVQEGGEAIGSKESTWSKSGATMFNVVSGLLFGKKPLIESYHVDPERILKAKQEARDVKFVSTNDILCSTFGNAINARVLMVPLNFRGRLSKFNANDAGNYEGALVFCPDDYETPSLIRQTLESGTPVFKRKGDTPLPGCCEGMSCTLGMVTSWVFPFFSQVNIDGCEQMMHLPHCDISMVPFDIAVVYQPKAGQIAVTFFVRSTQSQGLKEHCPIGNLIPTPEQYCSSN